MNHHHMAHRLAREERQLMMVTSPVFGARSVDPVTRVATTDRINLKFLSGLLTVIRGDGYNYLGKKKI